MLCSLSIAYFQCVKADSLVYSETIDIIHNKIYKRSNVTKYQNYKWSKSHIVIMEPPMRIELMTPGLHFTSK